MNRDDGGAPIVWRSAELESSERFEMHRTELGWSLRGVTDLPISGAPSQISYAVETDATWMTSTVQIDVTSASHDRAISMEHTDDGWLVNGERRSDLYRCIDVDLGWSPATNTLPIRRLQLDVGDAAGQTTAVWVRYPDLSIEPLAQSYRRVATDTYEYRSANFTAELLVDEHGRVTRYGDNIWLTEPDAD